MSHDDYSFHWADRVIKLDYRTVEHNRKGAKASGLGRREDGKAKPLLVRVRPLPY